MPVALQVTLRKNKRYRIRQWLANHSVGWGYAGSANPSLHAAPTFPVGGNFFLFQRYVLIKTGAVERSAGCPCGARGGTLDFQLNEEQLHLKKSVREFAEREIKPNVMKWDEAANSRWRRSRNWASWDYWE